MIRDILKSSDRGTIKKKNPDGINFSRGLKYSDQKPAWFDI